MMHCRRVGFSHTIPFSFFLFFFPSYPKGNHSFLVELKVTYPWGVFYGFVLAFFLEGGEGGSWNGRNSYNVNVCILWNTSPSYIIYIYTYVCTCIPYV